MRAAIVSAGLLLLASRALANSGFPRIVRYAGAEIGLSPTTWTAVQADDRSLLFGGTRLVTFDGERWKSAELRSGHSVRSLAFGRDGRLWAAAIGDLGWFEKSAGSWVFHSLVDRIPPEHAGIGTVWHVFALEHGALFVTADKVMRWDGKEFTIWSLPGSRHLRAFAVGAEIFVQHQPTGIYRMEPGGPTLMAPAKEIGESGIFLIEREGADWRLVTSAGIFLWNRGPAQFLENPASRFIREQRLTAALRLDDGRLALGTADAGILIASASGEVDRRITQADGLTEQVINALFSDHEGSLWAMTRSAVFRITVRGPTRYFDSRAGLPAQEVKSIQKAAGQITFLTNYEIYRLPEGQGTLQRTKPFGGPFSDLRATPSGTFVGGFGRLLAWDGKQATELLRKLRDIYLLSPAPEDGVFFAHDQDIFELRPDGTHRQVVAGLPDYACSMAMDQEGLVWIGTYSAGLLVAPIGSSSVNRAAPVPNLPELGSGRVSVRADSQGFVYALSKDGAWIRSPVSRTFTPVKNFPSSEVALPATDFDRAGRLWVVTAGRGNQPPALGRVARSPSGASWEAHSVEGLRSVGSPRSLFVDEPTPGRVEVWIGGTDGVVATTVEGEPRALRPQAPLLRATARIGSEAEYHSFDSPLPFNTSSIRFELSQPEFVYRDVIRLESRIDGIDRTWIPVGADSRRELDAIRDGSYALEVRAVAADTGVAGPITRFAFSVAPPWWRTAPALIGLAVSLAPFAYGIYRLRLRALSARNRELEEKVRQRTEQLELANAAKTQFVANMSHDIRNPLNGIVGLALALEDTRLSNDQRELVSTLRECTSYLSTLVDDVLDFASIEAGQVEIRSGQYIPAELLASVAATLRNDAIQSGARLTVEVDPALPKPLAGDAGRIQQILINFVSNSLKYAGGEILISATIPISAPGEIEFSVSDAGPGIGIEDQGKLFTKFGRLAGARQQQIPGSGLGLASCRLLADLMGGSVGVVSEPGTGARFFLRLPLTVSAPVARPDTTALPNTSVLLVEDADYNAIAMTAVLQRLGLTCQRARTGAEALALFEEHKFNLVLLDRNLPDLDGTAIARKIREREATGSRALILAVTAYCTAADRQLCLDAGMDAFVGKPLTPEKLRAVLFSASERLLAAASYQSEEKSPPAVPGLETKLLTYLSDGTAAGFATQVERYLAALEVLVRELETAIAKGNASEAAVSSHRLVGQARMVGAEELAMAAHRLEQVAVAGDLAPLAEGLAPVQAGAAKLRAALQRRPSAAPTA